MNQIDKKKFMEEMEHNYRIAAGVGALNALNAIVEQFKNTDGSIHIPVDKWIEFITPYTELPQ